MFVVNLEFLDQSINHENIVILVFHAQDFFESYVIYPWLSDTVLK